MRALVLSGGGSKGSYQVGALQYILGEKQAQYDILCGVSVGAINCAFLSMFEKYEEIDAIEVLSNLWRDLDTSKIYKRWFPFGRWHSIWKSSFYDSSPLINLIRNKVDLDKIRETGKQVSVGAISLSSGKYTIFSQNDDDFVDAVIASASFPGMLCPIRIRDQWWADGGVKEITPIKVAIESGASEIDIVMTSPETRNKYFIEEPTTMDVIKRAIDLSTDKIMSNDVEKMVMYNKLAEAGFSDKRIIKINIVRPKFNLIDNLLDFSPAKIQKMMEIGYLDAKTQYLI